MITNCDTNERLLPAIGLQGIAVYIEVLFEVEGSICEFWTKLVRRGVRLIAFFTNCFEFIFNYKLKNSTNFIINK